jgi:hypothetical protein
VNWVALKPEAAPSQGDIGIVSYYHDHGEDQFSIGARHAIIATL